MTFTTPSPIVAAHLAGMDHAKADIIAYAAQYVDDATNHGYILFNNGVTYSRVASAHKMLDYSNFSELANHRASVPFHFLAANDLKKAGDNHGNRFIYRLVCRAGSYVAQDMCAIVSSIVTAPTACTMAEADHNTIAELIMAFADADLRHEKWLDAIASGAAFSFGKQKVSYTQKGEGSWKHQALATDKAKDDDHEVFPYRTLSWRATGNCFTTPRSPTA